MRIGVVGSIWLNTPPRGYGGTEDVIFNLVNGLVERGHEVTFFGPKTAKVAAKLVPTIGKPLREMGVGWENSSYSLYHITEAFDRAGEFDILHVHLNRAADFVALPLSLNLKTPVIFTLHFQLVGPEDRADQYAMLRKYRALPYVSISDAQREANRLNYVRTVYNGLDLSKFPYSDSEGKYLVWLGKIKEEKGTREAILAAKRAGVKIFVMGTVDRGVGKMVSYYENEVKPLLEGKMAVELGEVSHNEKTSILSGAKAFLNPIQWEEPFGLVMAEAQSTGTPVISFNRGAASEVIEDGKTGFLVENLEEMVEKIGEVDHLLRQDCRQWVEERFSTERMVENYEEAYGVVVENWRGYLREQKELLSKNSKF